MATKGYRLLSIEAKDLYGAMRLVNPSEDGYSIRNADGKISLQKFTATLDWSLDSIKLEDVCNKKMRRKEFAFTVGKHKYTKTVICVTFNLAYKEFNRAGKNTYILYRYSYRDCVFDDCACVIDGKLIAIQVNQPVENPLPQEILGNNFKYENGQYVQVGNIPVVMGRADLRKYLYKHGFRCDGVDYVRYKRSSGSSRVGKCLFVNKEFSEAMNEWDKCGLSVEDGQKIDLAGWESYISLPSSSIIDTLEIPLESILVIDDYESKFDDEVIAVGIEDDRLASSRETVTVSNSIWDGQSMMDSSLFAEKYSDKGMLLLRNRFFKSCCFNTNLQEWFADNGVTSIDQLNGITLATDISQIKLVTTPSSIKFAKFGDIKDWLQFVDPTFGIVKHEKKPHAFDGRMVQAHYQLLNSLQLSYDDMEKVLAPSLEYIAAMRRDPAVLRYHIRYPYEDGNEVWQSMNSKNEIIFKMLGINDKFCQTKLYYDFRDDLIRSEIRNLKKGHILVNGNYSTLMGNGIEMLKASIGRFDGRSELGVGNIHSKRFEYGKTLLCSRSPHVTV